jgi:hypothetical protein
MRGGQDGKQQPVYAENVIRPTDLERRASIPDAVPPWYDCC